MTSQLLRKLKVSELQQLRRPPFDATTLAEAQTIVNAVRQEGESALRSFGARFGELKAHDALVIPRAALLAALAELPRETRSVLERTAGRIRSFAEQQRQALREVEVTIPGGAAGHVVLPVESAGCYAPGGRYPLPSSVLMTVIPARVAGVPRVWLATPRPGPLMLAAAGLAGADGVLTVGGAHAIAALAYGIGGVPACSMVAGPGNRFVTAAKYLVSADVGIDLLAGPSELVVLADDGADAGIVAADLLAQAEHDPDALPILVTTSGRLVDVVERALVEQLKTLPSAEMARAALRNGGAIVADGIEQALDICDQLAPEHLELQFDQAHAVAERLRNYGSLFIGSASAEVLGDFGAGPNHTLPTGGTARHCAGLSVLAFLRCPTWMRIDDPPAASELVHDAAQMARLERLEGHARAAERRNAK